MCYACERCASPDGRGRALRGSGVPARREPLDPPGARLARWRRRAPGIFVSFAGSSGGLALLRLPAVSYAVVIVPVVDSGTHRDPEVEHTGSCRAAAPDGAGAGRLEVEGRTIERERRTRIDLCAVDDGTEIHGSRPGI